MTDEQFKAERAAFIAHFTPLQPMWGFQDDGTGGFHHQSTEWAWIGWQARAAGVRACPTPDHCRAIQRCASVTFDGKTQKCDTVPTGVDVPRCSYPACDCVRRQLPCKSVRPAGVMGTLEGGHEK